MTNKRSRLKIETTKKLLDIESRDRLTSKSINALSNNPQLLKEYLESSLAHTFSELLFRLTYEIYSEEKASQLWKQIVTHKIDLEKMFKRDVGILVAALDYLTNVTGDLSSPKIMDDLRIEEAADIATRDSLTGLYIRAIFEFSLSRIIAEHARYDKKLSLLLADIDGFKQVNDRFGHQAGDDVLRRIGKLFLDTIREADLPARYGGEEFSVILPETPINQAVALAERLCKKVYQHFSEKGPELTISIGVSCIQKPSITTALQLVHSADKALYTAKHAGKNRVEKYEKDSHLGS
jgi:diguanylate cyclase (GGDEF)-like protein